MQAMRQSNIARIESQLTRLVEGTFASLFGKSIRAPDIALDLLRTLRESARDGTDDGQPVAPDEYLILLNPEVQRSLSQRQPNLTAKLAGHLTDYASKAGYQLENAVVVHIGAEASLAATRCHVVASFSDTTRDSQPRTQAMQRVTVSAPNIYPLNAQLLINDQRVIPLARDIVNIGRHPDNDIVLDDPTVSRHHVQLRLRFGEYLIFNTHGRSGTSVNGVKIKEHRLKSGDVITIGGTRIVYTHDIGDEDTTTGTFFPV